MNNKTHARFGAIALLSGAVLAPVASYAISIPHEFHAGEPVIATELNENFEALRAEIEREPLHLRAYVVPGAVIPVDDLWHELLFEPGEYDNTGAVIGDGDSVWRFEVPESGVYLIHLTLVANWESSGGEVEEFFSVRAVVDGGERYAEAISRENAGCCVRRATASAARYLEQGQLVSVEVKSFNPANLQVHPSTVIDITRID